MIKSFNEISEKEYFQQLENKLRSEIHNESTDYILSLDENEYKSFLINKYRLEKIEIFKSKERFTEPQKGIDTIKDKYGRSIKRSVYYFTIEYPFSGDPSLFSVRPSQYSTGYKPIEVDTRNNIVSTNFNLINKDQDQFEIEKEMIFGQAFINLDSLNNSVERWNSLLPQKVDSIFDEKKQKALEENELNKEPNKKVEEKAKSVATVPPDDEKKQKDPEENALHKEANVKVEEKAKSVAMVSPDGEKKQKDPEESELNREANVKVEEKAKSVATVSPDGEKKQKDPEENELNKEPNKKVEEKAKSVATVPPDDEKEQIDPEENEVNKEANIKVDEKTNSVFTDPPVKGKIMPKQSTEKDEKVAFDPYLSNELYIDILNIIYDVGKKMEKKPSLYLDKDEEDLRDQFLLFLETRYEGETETGEVFNKTGNTDIILKYSEDGTNLFVAECRFWHGINVFKKAVNQLFDRYLTWKDSKVALLFFVTNKNFSSVLTEVKQHISEHPYYKTYLGDKGDSSFAYKFHLPNHDDIEIDLEVMLFHFPYLD